MTKLLCILLVGLVLEAVGVVFISQGLHEIGEVKRISAPEIGRIIGRGISNRNILFGTLLMACFFRHPTLPAFAKGRQPDLAADLARLCHHRTGGASGPARGSQRAALDGRSHHRDWRGIGRVERTA